MLVIGIIFDVFGRKWPCIFGIVLSGVTFFGFPMFHEVYPYFSLLYILNSIGNEIPMNAPFLPDYIDSSSAGLASSYIGISFTISGLIGGSLVPFLGSVLSD